MTKQLQSFYNLIETNYTTGSCSLNISSNIGEVSKDEQDLINYELISLNYFEADIFKERIQNNKKTIVAYFKQRIGATKNIHLLAKYYHFILYVSQNNSFAPKVIEYYQQVLSYYLEIYSQDYNILHFSDVLRIIISICIRYNVDVDNLKNQVSDYLSDDTLSLEIKAFILENIQSSKLLKNNELLTYPKLCIDLAAVVNNSNIKERLLNLALSFSRKITNRELIKLSNELLGDFEYGNILPDDKKNIAISHLNENTYTKIINYYKSAGQKGKLAKAVLELEKNKKNHQYIKIQSKISIDNAKHVNQVIARMQDALLTNSPEILVAILCFDSESLLFPQHKRIKESINKSLQNTSYHQFFDSKLMDFNENISAISHKSIGEHYLFSVHLHNYTFTFVTFLLGRAIQEGKFSYVIVKRYLRNNAFGIQLSTKRGDKTLKYNWFDIVDIGIKEFFKQYSSFVKGKKTDWRMTIDFLAPKFEAILRDIIQITNGGVTRVKGSGDTELKSLEDLLGSPILNELFSEDDIFLFRHTFTKAGLNIRNNVAHGLYKPFDYTLSNAILVFLCLLRLNKVYFIHS